MYGKEISVHNPISPIYSSHSIFLMFLKSEWVSGHIFTKLRNLGDKPPSLHTLSIKEYLYK